MRCVICGAQPEIIYDPPVRYGTASVCLSCMNKGYLTWDGRLGVYPGKEPSSYSHPILPLKGKNLNCAHCGKKDVGEIRMARDEAHDMVDLCLDCFESGYLAWDPLARPEEEFKPTCSKCHTELTQENFYTKKFPPVGSRYDYCSSCFEALFLVVPEEKTGIGYPFEAEKSLKDRKTATKLYQEPESGAFCIKCQKAIPKSDLDYTSVCRNCKSNKPGILAGQVSDGEIPPAECATCKEPLNRKKNLRWADGLPYCEQCLAKREPADLHPKILRCDKCGVDYRPGLNCACSKTSRPGILAQAEKDAKEFGESFFTVTDKPEPAISIKVEGSTANPKSPEPKRPRTICTACIYICGSDGPGDIGALDYPDPKSNLFCISDLEFSWSPLTGEPKYEYEDWVKNKVRCKDKNDGECPDYQAKEAPGQ